MKSEFNLGRLPSGLSSTEVLVFVCELDELSGDLWYRRQEGQGVREARLAREWQAAGRDWRVSRPCGHGHDLFFLRYDS